MFYKALDIELSFAGGKVLPITDPAFKEYNDFKEKYGEDGSVMVIGIQSDKIFQKDFFNDWYKLSNEIKKYKGIQQVLSIGRLYDLRKDTMARRFDLVSLVNDTVKTQSELDSIKEKIYSLPFYEGLIYQKEKSATLIAITFEKKNLNSRNRIRDVETIEAMAEKLAVKHNVDLHYSGLPYIRTVISKKVSNEFQLFLGLAILITAIILFLFFRSFYAVLFSLLVVIIGVIWSIGSMVLLGYKMTLLTGLLPPLIVVIGIPNSVLLLNKYHNEFRKHGDKTRALMMVIQRIGITILLANITTAIGFGVFYFTHSEILSEFGIVTALNIMATYLVALVMIPILFSYLPSPTVKHTKHLENKLLGKLIDKIDYLVHHYRTRIYIITIAIVVFSLVGVYKININGYMVDDLPKKDPVYVDLKFFESTFKGIMPFEITIDAGKKNGIMNPTLINKVDKLGKMMAAYPEFSRPLSLNEVLKFSTQAFYNGSAAYYGLPNSLERNFILSYTTQSKGSNQLLRTFIDSNRQQTRVSFQMADVGSLRMNELVKELQPRIDSIVGEKYKVSITGASTIFLKGNNYLITNLRESLILAIFLISVLMFLLFRSAKMIAISLLPNIIPLLITAGLMGYFGISLKPSTVLIFSIAFGIASDQTIYFLSKYRQDLKNKDWSISKTVSIALHETGVSMIYTAIILFFGFGIFAASTFGGTVSLGILVSVTLLVAVVCNLILLPSLLLTLEKRIKRKAMAEPFIQVYDEDEDIDLDDLKVKGK